MGPLVTREHREKVRGYIDLGVKEGAKLVVDGRGLKLQGYENGYLPRRLAVRQRHAPTCVSTRRRSSARCCRRGAHAGHGERGADDERARIRQRRRDLHLDGGAARDFTQAIKIGMVGINVPIPVPMAFHSFGGWKHSLFGDHHIYGPEGVRFYTRYKAVTQRWPTGHGGGRSS